MKLQYSEYLILGLSLTYLVLTLVLTIIILFYKDKEHTEYLYDSLILFRNSFIAPLLAGASAGYLLTKLLS